MGCEKREAVELLLLTTIDRSIGCTNSSLDIYKLHNSSSWSRSKHSEEFLVAGGRQIGKAPLVPGSESAVRSKEASNPGVPIPPRDPSSNSSSSRRLVFLLQEQHRPVMTSCSGSGETSLLRTVSMRVCDVDVAIRRSRIPRGFRIAVEPRIRIEYGVYGRSKVKPGRREDKRQSRRRG